jgi:hypothetical protein
VVKEIYKERIKVLIDLWGMISQNINNIDRSSLVKLLQKSYEERGIKPIRGFKTENLYEKELISLYVIGKDGLGLYNDYEDFFHNILFKEEKLEKFLALIEEDVIEAFKFLNEDKEELAKALRMSLIKVLFGFSNEEDLFRKLRKLSNVNLDPVKHTSISFSRFYTAFKIAEGIAEGSINNKIMIDAMRKAIAISIGVKFPLPKYSYIQLIAKEVFGVPDDKLKRILANIKITKRR